jgi:hypothetical protein
MRYYAEFEWLDGSTRIFDQFIQIKYSTGFNIPGSFVITLPDNDDALDILIGSNVYIYKGKQRIFGGRTQKRKITEKSSIKITGADFTGLLNLREMSYDSLGDIESSEVIKTILRTWIRDPLENIPLYNIDYTEHIFTTQTTKRWQFNKTSVLNACSNIAQTSSSAQDRIGYVFYLDPYLYVHLEPLGSYELKDIIPMANIVFDEDYLNVKNLIEYYGGKEITYPAVPDSWTDLGNAPYWTVEECSGGCQTSCQTNCEVGPCQVCGQYSNTQETCDLACQGSCVSACQDTCETSCQSVCQAGCQVCADGGNLVGI